MYTKKISLEDIASIAQLDISKIKEILEIN